MNKIKSKKLDEATIFAEKYLGFNTEDIVFIPKLVEKLTDLFKIKKDNLKQDDNILELMFTKEDQASLCYFEKTCLDFKESFRENDLEIDKYGFIGDASNLELIGKNVLELDGFKEIKMGLLVNMMTSKIYQAILERLRKNYGPVYGEAFLNSNLELIFYEKRFLEKISLMKLKKDIQIRQRSLR